MTAPVLQAPTRGITAPQLVPGVEGLLSLGVDASPADELWITGYEYNPEVPIKDARNVSLYDPTHVGTNMGTGVAAPLIQVRPWQMRVLDVVSTFQRNMIDYDARNRRILDAYASKLLEREAWSGEIAVADNLPNRYFTKPGLATVVNGGTALKPQAAVAEIVQAASDGGHVGPIMIHMPKKIAIRLPDAWRNTTTLEDHGFVVIGGAGYPGTSPAGAGSNWMYATGQANYRLSDYEIRPIDDTEYIDTTKNDITHRVQRIAAVDFAGPVFVCNTDLT
jgi:hypothetical protein